MDEEEKPKWYRTKNGLVAGVISGVADKLELHVALLRATFIIVTIATGVFPGVVIYAAAAIFLPIKNDPNNGADEDIPDEYRPYTKHIRDERKKEGERNIPYKLSK